jgi:choline dehydrogenase-like flavoprotein
VSFATKYISNIANQENLVVSLNSAVVDIEIQRSRIASFRVRDLQGENRAVRAENFVLACGGIENSRLLLHFAARSEGRLAANPDALGRYWMEHPHYTIGEVVMTDPDETGREVFSPMPERMLRSGVLNCGLRLEWTRDRKGLRRAAHDLGCAAPTLGRWIYRQMDKRLICIGTLRAAWEQEPNPDSRVRLSAGRRDAFGMPLAVLEWRKTARDVATARNAAIDLGAFLARTGRARVRLHDWVTQDGPWPANDEHGGFHHMGGTRMSDVPARGVVDRDLRLWSSDNLFVAGSSVFPAAGHANPTLTIVQLSLRLADRLG